VTRTAQTFRPFPAAILLIALAAIVASCATPPRPVMQSVVVSVVSVEVSSDFGVDPAFVASLYEFLEQTMGRSTGDIGRDARLRVYVRSIERSFAGLGGTTAVYDAVLVSSENGRILYSTPARRTESDPLLLIPGMTEDLRRLVGLEGTVPVPVGAVKKPVIHPVRKPAPTIAVNPVVSADPLLNGAVTPTDDVRDEVAPAPVLDTSKPLLAPAPAPKSLARDAMAEEDRDGDIISGDEPCVVTVANDCTVFDAAE